MRRIVCVALIVMLAGAAYAELQNVQVGGQIRIRGRYWRNGFDGDRETRIPNSFLQKRPIGFLGASSVYDWDDNGNDRKIVEQRTSLYVSADFTDDVCAFIELQDYTVWGEDFRSNYITGADSRANSVDDVEVQQAYIQMESMLGQPLRLRIGRQDLVFGKGWLIGNQISPTLGLSYDAIRLTYDTDVVCVDAVWAKLAEMSPAEEDGDVDLYAIYATYKQLEAIDLSAYWFWVRDGRSINDTNFIAPLEWVEDVLGLDNYDVTNLHTFGIRANGAAAGFDYDLEVAYQTGEADAVGAGFTNQLYGDDHADFDAWAADLELGYTFDIMWTPRVYVGGAYFGGEDNRDLTVLDWLNPFYRPDASVSFNRLFSMKWYSGSWDILGGAAAFSNFTQARGGFSVHPTESVSAGLGVTYTWVNEEFDAPVTFDIGALRIPVAPALAFWTDKADDDIGLATHVWVKYDYSEDLFVKVGWEHLFTGSAMEDGSFLQRNGLDFMGGSDHDEADYIYFDTCVKF